MNKRRALYSLASPNILAMSGTTMNSSFHLAMPAMNSGRQCMPTGGVFCMVAASISVTSKTLSAMMPDRRGVAVEFDLQHDEAGIDGRFRRLHAEAQAQIGKRDHLAAHVEHVGDIGLGAGHPRHRRGIEDFAHLPRVEREHFARDPHQQGLRRHFRVVVV